jgi:RNA polymerase primary sigma factor
MPRGRATIEQQHITETLTQFMNNAGRYPLLTGTEELELARRIERGDLAAKERLINSNLRLVMNLARRYQNADVELIDLVQEGTVGLIRAVEKFDYRKGFRFSTYATMWIRQALQRGIADRGRAIRLPANVAGERQRFDRAERELTTTLGREPTDPEIAERIKSTPERVDELRNLSAVTASLDRPVGDDDGGAVLGDLIAGESPSIDDELADKERSERLERSLEALPRMEKHVLELRYGIKGDDPTTATAAAKQLNLTHGQLKQAEASALRRLADDPELRELIAA